MALERVRDVPRLKGGSGQAQGCELLLLLGFEGECFLIESVKLHFDDLRMVRYLVHIIINEDSEVFYPQELLDLSSKLTKMREGDRLILLVGCLNHLTI